MEFFQTSNYQDSDAMRKSRSFSWKSLYKEKTFGSQLDWAKDACIFIKI